MRVRGACLRCHPVLAVAPSCRVACWRCVRLLNVTGTYLGPVFVFVQALSKIGVTKVITGVDMTSDDIGTVLNAGLGDDLKLDLVINNAGMLVHETCVESLCVLP